MQSDKRPTLPAPLWTRDFTIITVGSVISMLMSMAGQMIE